MQMPVNVKCYLIPHTQSQYMVSYLHPLAEKAVRRRFTSKEEAFHYKEETEKKFRRNDFTLLHGLKIADYIPLYMEKEKKPHFVRMKKIFKDFYETFNEFTPQEITQDVIEVWFKQLKEENNYADATMFRIRTTTNSFFLFLIREGVLRESPVPSMQFDPYQFPQKRKRNLLSEEDLQTLLREAKNINPNFLYPILLMFVETAAKATEILALSWEDIDLRAGHISFKALPRTCARSVKISPELKQILEKSKKISSSVFTYPYHQPVNKNKFARMLSIFKRESNFKKIWSPWDFRYSFAYHFLQKGGTIEGLQNILGHHRPQETSKRYGHFLPREGVSVI